MTHKISERPRFSKKTNISLDLSRIHGHGVLSTVHSFGSLIKTSFSFPPSPASWRSLGTFTRALPVNISTLSRIFANCYFQDALHANPLFCWYFVHPDKDYRRFPHFSKGFSQSNRRRHDGPSYKTWRCSGKEQRRCFSQFAAVPPAVPSAVPPAVSPSCVPSCAPNCAFSCAGPAPPAVNYSKKTTLGGGAGHAGN